MSSNEQTCREGAARPCPPVLRRVLLRHRVLPVLQHPGMAVQVESLKGCVEGTYRFSA